MRTYSIAENHSQPLSCAPLTSALNQSGGSAAEYAIVGLAYLVQLLGIDDQDLGFVADVLADLIAPGYPQMQYGGGGRTPREPARC